MRAELPEGWNQDEKPGMTLRIMPAARSSRSSGLVLVMAGLGCCIAAVFLFGALFRGGAAWRGMRLTLLLPLGLLLVWHGLWLAFGREEWRVGDDLLEVRQTLFGFHRVRRFRGSTLRITGSTGGRSSRAHRSLLRAARAGAAPRNAAGNWWGLFVVDQRGERCLHSSSRGSARQETLRSLGELLSERTGWPLLLPRQRKKR